MDIKNVFYLSEDDTNTADPGSETPPATKPDTDTGTEDEKFCPHSWIYQTIPDFYDRVRNSLNVGSLIDNTTIDFFENAPMAEMKVIERLPDYSKLTGIKRMLFETSIVYMTCYALCPIASTMRISRQKDPSLELEFSSSASTENPCDRFLGMVDDLIGQINGEETSNFFGFRVTKGRGCSVVKPCWPYRSRSAYKPLWGEKY